ncbi:uncharacterized protein LOC129308529 isoform X1 [Prosopis cineraria]|uniref:uncharacterized protein LOC129308529 isoform X1 n=1 Tax=Prosopis cineraria TaxID=364024 RepID=UPI002410A5D8|nr:uncharacterized protein LOC129308529 isoform X1 [Prosopis cineraria]
MEFNFRQDDLKSPSFQFPSPIQSHFSDPSLLRGGFPSVFSVPPNTEQLLNPNVAGEDLLRKLEKERIRREIISGEIARRRMLEEEVRRELMLERELAFRRSLGEKFLLDEQVGLNPRLNVIPCHDNRPLEERIAFPSSRQTVAQVTQPVNPRIKPDPDTNKYKLIMLAKPKPDLYREKRKVVTQDADDDDTEPSPASVRKKSKDDWSCALCSVSVTSEKALNEHRQGKKHKAREYAQKRRMQKIGMSASPSFTSKNSEKSLKSPETIVTTTTSGLKAKADAQVQPEVTKVDTNNQTVVGEDLVEIKTEGKEMVEKIQTENSKKQNRTETEKVMIPNAENKRFKFWCELCHVGSFSMIVMDNHKRGRKHNNRLKRSRQNDGIAPPAYSGV